MSEKGGSSGSSQQAPPERVPSIRLRTRPQLLRAGAEPARPSAQSPVLLPPGPRPRGPLPGACPSGALQALSRSLLLQQGSPACSPPANTRGVFRIVLLPTGPSLSLPRGRGAHGRGVSKLIGPAEWNPNAGLTTRSRTESSRGEAGVLVEGTGVQRDRGGQYQRVTLSRAEAGPRTRHDQWSGGLCEGLTFMLRSE